MDFGIYFCVGYSLESNVKERKWYHISPISPMILEWLKPSQSLMRVRVYLSGNGIQHHCPGRDRHQKETGFSMETILLS